MANPLTFTLQNSDDDVSQFDTKFTRQIPIDSPDDATLSESCNMIFQVNNDVNDTYNYLLNNFQYNRNN